MSSNNDSWDERRKAQEEDFFRRQNDEAVKRIQKRQAEEKPRLSPITGEPMAQKSFMGVVVDICETSGGIWLDSGELDQIINLTKETDQGKENLLSRFFSDLFHTK